MLTIQSASSPLPMAAFGTNAAQNRAGSAQSFEAVMFRASMKTGAPDALLGFIDEMLDHIAGSLQHPLGAAASVTPARFAFTPAFESTFGLAGPLPEFITATTKRLGLSAEQNRALQDIAVRNRDIVKTPESVRKIAMELQQAGITG